MEKHRNYLLHTRVTYDLRVCHVFDSRSFVQVRGHCQEMHKSYLGHVMENKLDFDTDIACDRKICPDLGIWSIVQVQGHFKKVVHQLLSDREKLEQ